MAFFHFAVRGEKLTMRMEEEVKAHAFAYIKNRPEDLQLVFEIKVQLYLSIDVSMSALFNIPIITYC
jgi:hypothetical protein